LAPSISSKLKLLQKKAVEAHLLKLNAQTPRQRIAVVTFDAICDCYLRPSGCCTVQCPTCGAKPGVWCWQEGPTATGKRVLVQEERKLAAGRFGAIGWHTFRYTYRSWLDETGAPMEVQQELMRHASNQTTMNVYGKAMPESKREATWEGR
jgi:hypothetical protein